MLVGDKNSVQILDLFADFGEPPGQFANAEPRIDQNARLRSGKERRVTGTAARECAKSDQETKLLRSVLAQRAAETQRAAKLPLHAAIFF
jgi:hypothetical protein